MSFNPSAGLRVFGLLEAIRGLDSKIRGAPQARRTALQEVATFFKQDAQANAHVITGKTKGSIRIESVTDRQAIISAGFGMPFEEKRAGSKGSTPHATFTESAKRTQVQGPRIVKRHYDRTATGRTGFF